MIYVSVQKDVADTVYWTNLWIWIAELMEQIVRSYKGYKIEASRYQSCPEETRHIKEGPNQALVFTCLCLLY